MDYKELTIAEIITSLRNEKINFIELPENLRDNKEIVLEVIQYHNHILNYASKRLRDDEEVILQALKHYNYILVHASERLKDDKEIVSLAINKSIINFYHASPRLQNERDLLEVLEKAGFKKLNDYYFNWYNERMEVLASFREKDLMEKEIPISMVKSKKIKF